MKIILANGTELNPIMVTGGSRFIAGFARDTLNFIFPEETSLDEIDSLFTAENCESVKVYDVETGVEYIHNGYIIRAELKRSPTIVIREIETTEVTEGEETATETTETPKTEEIIENRVIVAMSLQTYTEKQVAVTQGIINALLGEDE